MKKTVYEKEITELDGDTGEIKKRVNTVVKAFNVEPDYVKVYLQDICYFNDIPKSQMDVLFHLLKHLNYENCIVITSRIRKEIAERLNIGPQTLSNKINKLAKSQMIKIVGRNEYEVNPNFFGRGEWQKVMSRRETGDFTLEIKYDKDGKREINTKLDRPNKTTLKLVKG